MGASNIASGGCRAPGFGAFLVGIFGGKMLDDLRDVELFHVLSSFLCIFFQRPPQKKVAVLLSPIVKKEQLRYVLIILAIMTAAGFIFVSFADGWATVSCFLILFCGRFVQRVS